MLGPCSFSVEERLRKHLDHCGDIDISSEAGNFTMSGLARRVSSKIRSASGNLVGDKLKNLDAYPKTLDDFRIKTKTGAAGVCLDSFVNTCAIRSMG